MAIRSFGRTIGETLAYGLGFWNKAERQLDRPPVGTAGDGVYQGNVVRFTDESERESRALSNIYFYSNGRVLSQKVGSAELYVKKRIGERKESIENHPFERLFRRPNFLFSRAELMEHSVWWLFLKGNAYWYKVMYGDELVELWPMRADQMKPIPHKKDVIAGYKWETGDGEEEIIPKDKIVHFRMVNPYSVINGMNAIDALRYAIEGSNARFKWELEFFSEQRAVPEGLLGVAPETQQSDIDRIREQLVKEYGGGQRRIAVGRTGKMTFQRFALTQEEMVFLERLQYDEKLFDRVFGFPGGYWDAMANRANAYQATKSLVQDTVLPLLGKFAGNIEVQILNPHYEKGGDEDLCCEFEDITPEDEEQSVAKFEAYSPVLTVDEARVMAHYDPIGGNVGSMLVSMIPALVQAAGQGFIDIPAEASEFQPKQPPRLEMRNEIVKWAQIAQKEIRKGRDPSEREFISEVIPYEVKSRIETELVGAIDTDDVKEVFEPWLGG